MSSYLDQLRAETNAAIAECLASLDRMNDAIERTNASLRERQTKLRAEIDALGTTTERTEA